MAKLNSKEFIEKWEEKLSIADDDLSIEFREDIADSINESEDNSELEEAKAEIEKLKADLADSKQRYKDRFLTSDVYEENEEEKVEDEEPKEEEIIDVKEI